MKTKDLLKDYMGVTEAVFLANFIEAITKDSLEANNPSVELMHLLEYATNACFDKMREGVKKCINTL